MGRISTRSERWKYVPFLRLAFQSPTWTLQAETSLFRHSKSTPHAIPRPSSVPPSPITSHQRQPSVDKNPSRPASSQSPKTLGTMKLRNSGNSKFPRLSSGPSPPPSRLPSRIKPPLSGCPRPRNGVLGPRRAPTCAPDSIEGGVKILQRKRRSVIAIRQSPRYRRSCIISQMMYEIMHRR